MKIVVTRYTSILTLGMMLFNTLIPFQVSAASKDEIVYPLKEISKLECRFEDYDKLSSNCKTQLPILQTKDYKKYASLNGWYNDFTRLYKVLWGSSYKYGWDVWNWGHQGTDIATAKWTPVYSIADGKVIAVWNDVWWGKYVSIEHTIRGKKIVSNYAHLHKITVNKGDNVDVSDKIWEVWSTWNSTWNHLHFQIDLPSSFHPYYYDWNACPYGYYEITEKWVCFDELAKNTFDPLEFLETNGAVVDEIVTSQSSEDKKIELSITKSSLNDVLTTTVYYGYGTSFDVQNVQELYTLLWYYNGAINWNYSDVESAVISYQLDRWVISSKDEDWAGWFGPKTRAQTKIDYNSYLANGGKVEVVVVESSENSDSVIKEDKKITTISRVNLKTREEIEKQEMDEFLNKYDIRFADTASQVEVWKEKSTTLSITDSRGRWYRGNTPWNVTFVYDTSVVSVFPESFYSFTNGTRDIKITGLKKGNTKVTMKIWNVEIKTFSVSVWNRWEKLSASSAKLLLDDDVILGKDNTWIILLQDQYGTNLVRSEFAWEITLRSGIDARYCIKKWRLQDIKEIYMRKCFEDEYTDTLTYTYSDTIEWILVFDYKVLSEWTTQFTLKKTGKQIAWASVVIDLPKDLERTYAYIDEVEESLMSGIATTNSQWNFKHETNITRKDAVQWIYNTMQDLWIENNDIYAEDTSFKELNRQEYLDLVAKYLSNRVVSTWWYSYRDWDEDLETSVAALLWNTYKWKDHFWDNYFQPDKEITRWEAAYLLVHALRAQNQWAVATN